MSVVPVTRGHHHVVSAGHELAALAEALDNGGNAIDASVAAILTLGVVYSDQVSVAGVAPMLIRLAQTGGINHPRAPPLHALLTQPPASPSPALS